MWVCMCMCDSICVYKIDTKLIWNQLFCIIIIWIKLFEYMLCYRLRLKSGIKITKFITSLMIDIIYHIHIPRSKKGFLDSVLHPSVSINGIFNKADYIQAKRLHPSTYQGAFIWSHIYSNIFPWEYGSRDYVWVISQDTQIAILSFRPQFSD